MKHLFKHTAMAASLLSGQAVLAQTVGLEEIVVTAQFRAESLQDAGLAIDAVSSEKLIKSGITSAADLSQIVPALTVTNGGGINSLLYMRGVGNTANNDYLDPAIIVTYDGVALARGSGASLSAFYDMERVEVLKGPQGTLYGKNATGGVINLIPVKPQIGETGGFINASLGNYDDRQFSGAINIPVGETSAFRLAGNSLKHDGYNKDGTNDADVQSVRAQFLTEMSDDLSIRVAADFSDIGGVGAGTTAVGRYQGSGLANYSFIPSGLDANEGQNTQTGNDYRNSILSAPGFGFLNDIQEDWYTDAEMKGMNAEIKYESEIGELTVIPAWREVEQDSKFGQPGFNSGWWQSSVEQTSLEIRLAGEGSDLVDYLVGAYYFEESMEGNNTFNQEFVLPMQDYEQDSDSWAAFSQLTWNLTDSTRLITGARYTDDHKEMTGGINNYITFCGGLPGNGFTTPPASFALGCQIPGNLPHFPTLDTPAQADAFLIDNGWAAAFVPIPNGYIIPLTTGKGTILHDISTVDGSVDKQKTTYRLSLEWDVLEESMVYVSFETGYRSGGLQPSTTSTYAPEFLDAYTIGTKNRFMDGRVQLNAELFYWDYEDQQISYFALNDLGVLENITDNVGTATNKGLDVDLLWLVTENTLLSSKMQWLDASYDDLHFLTAPPRDNINCPYTITGFNNGVPALDFNCSNNDAIFSPEWTWQFGIEQTIPMEGMNLIVSLDTNWVDDQVTGFTNLPHEVIESHWTTNADITLASAEDTWSVSAYVRNIEDNNEVRSTQSPLLGMALASYGPDMTYGMRVNYRF